MNYTHEKRKFKESPEKRANFISKLTFWWMKDIYELGTKGILQPEDIYQIKSEFASKSITEEFIKLWKDEMERKNPSMLRLLFKMFGESVFLWGICYSALDIGMRICHSLCLGGLVDFFSDNEMSVGEGMMYATGLFSSLAISAVSCHPYMIYVHKIAAHIKIGLTGLIYRKVLRLPLSSIYESLNGRVINIMADDVNHFDMTLEYLHHVWKGPCEIIIFGYFIFDTIGVAGMVGISVLLCFIPVQAYLARTATILQNKLSKQTDIRIRIMSETINGIRVIKMYGLEHVFENVIKNVRSTEIGIIQSLYRIRVVLVTLSLLTRISIFVSLITYLNFSNDIAPRTMFITFAFFNLLNWSMLWQWPFALIHCGQGYVALKRVQAFLQTNEMSTYASIEASNDASSMNRIIFPKDESKAIILTNVTSKWIAGSNRSSGIYNSSLNVASGELCAVIGPVGSGKSSLLHVISGELSIQTGKCEIYGTISYASQMPWIFEGTVRQNIVFTETFDDDKFQQVLQVCCLNKDIERMPHEDLTLVGECGGFSLSGGQSARINLARAVYRTADIYIFDDSLAALDFKIGKYIVQRCIQDYLAGHCRIIVTNELQYFKNADQMVLMQDGRVEAQGTLAEVQEHGLVSFLNVKPGDANAVNDEKVPSKSLLSLFTIFDDNYYARRNEKHFEGSRMDVYKFYFSSFHSVHFLVLIVFLFILAQALLSGIDYYISNWNTATSWELMSSAYKIKTLGGTIENNVSLSVNVSDHSAYIRTYCGLMTAGTIAYFYRTFEFFALCLSASIALHDQLFASIMRAKISFFDSNPSGRIVNRFSKDLINIDLQLGQALIEFLTFTLELVAAIIMVSIIVNMWMLIPSILIAMFFCFLRYIFTRTSQCVQRIESISRSPLYSHINNTLQGLSTIRVYNVENVLEEEFYEHLDFHSAVEYLKGMTSRAFTVWVDVLCLVYIGICSVSFVLYRDSETRRSELFGIAMLHCINLIGMCQWGTRDSAEIEYEMTSVERIIEYTKIPSEPPLKCDSKKQPPKDWPSGGEIIFKNVNFKYANSRSMILNDLNFKIFAKEKVGIVGRTGKLFLDLFTSCNIDIIGAGKTSIVEALFRMEEFDGEIVIDGILTTSLGLHDLRQNISIIPQMPILFSGTLRFNLDPFREVTDAEIWNSLNQVEMKEFIQTLPGGLDYKLVKGGLNFSMGQRQLICLARAILRNNNILISDEATASVDPDTDQVIQKTIRLNFSHCTVLTISHQLHNIMDSDRILVMENGRVVEFDQPIVLLMKVNGHLRKLVDQNDPVTIQMLTDLAKKSS